MVVFPAVCLETPSKGSPLGTKVKSSALVPVPGRTNVVLPSFSAASFWLNVTSKNEAPRLSVLDLPRMLGCA